jgi:hypothetical protein
MSIASTQGLQLGYPRQYLAVHAETSTSETSTRVVSGAHSPVSRDSYNTITSAGLSSCRGFALVCARQCSRVLLTVEHCAQVHEGMRTSPLTVSGLVKAVLVEAKAVCSKRRGSSAARSDVTRQPRSVTREACKVRR